jgi:hypothetical protein
MIVETSALRDGVCPASALPMPLPAIPSIEQVGESIIAEARHLMDHREAKHPSKPDVAWGAKPNGDRTIRTDVQVALCINGMQPATHILDPGAEAGEHIGLEIDVSELDHASSGGTDESTVLPIDARVTDGALGIVPDSERRIHF